MLKLILDQEGRCLDATDELLQLLGYSRAELSRLPLQEVLAVRNPMWTVWQAQTIVGQSGDETVPVDLRRRDGTLVPGELRRMDSGTRERTWVVRPTPAAGGAEPTVASPLPSILAEWRELTRQFNALAEDDPERIALSNRIDEVRSRYQAAARQVSDPVRESVIPRS